MTDELAPESRERLGEQAQRHLEAGLRDNSHMEGRRGHTPSPPPAPPALQQLAVLEPFAWREVPKYPQVGVGNQGQGGGQAKCKGNSEGRD